MAYDFDEIIERTNTNSLKYDFAKERGKPEDLLPLWVADMDFRAPKEVVDALVASSRHGIFGYTEVKDDYYKVIEQWFLKRFGWKTEAEWLVKTPGIMFAIAHAIKAFTNKGDSVMIQKPVYYPFTEVIVKNERVLINNSLVYKDGTYHIDFEDFEEKIVKNKVKIFVLCSPHNPVGRVWTRDELIRMGDLCLKYGVLVVSDEIHGDFVYPEYKHHIFLNIKNEYADNTILCTAPSKTFNLAGLQNSNIFIPNKEIRKVFSDEIQKSGYSQLNTSGLVASKAAYEYGESWLAELMKYLSENLRFIRDFLKEKLPEIKLVEPQGTYLVWLDFSKLGLTEKEIENLVVYKARLWLDRGTMFGKEGIGFQRINMACPRAVLEEGLGRLEKAVRSLNK